MSLNNNQLNEIKRLIKNSYGRSDIKTDFTYIEEPYYGLEPIYNQQLYLDDIPNTAPYSISGPEPSGTNNGVVAIYKDIVLNYVSGGNGYTYHHPLLVDAIPYNFGDGSYCQFLKDNTLNEIEFGNGDWFIDVARGTLRFYGDLPSGVGEFALPRISFFRYVGRKGLPPTIVADLTNVGTGGTEIYDTTVANIAQLRKIRSGHSGVNIFHNVSTNTVDVSLILGNIDHNSLANLSIGDPHTQYIRNGFGRSGGQIIIGGTDANDNLILRSTSNGIKGQILVDEIGENAFQVNGGASTLKGFNVGTNLLVNNQIQQGLEKTFKQISGIHILGTTGFVPFFRLRFKNLGLGSTSQYLVLEFNVYAWSSILPAGTELYPYKVQFELYVNPSGLVVIREMDARLSNNKFNFQYTAPFTAEASYNGNGSDIIGGTIQSLKIGPNYNSELDQFTFL